MNMQIQAPNASTMNRKRTQALSAPRTIRRHAVRGLTSLPAGKMVPLLAVPVLREDAVKSGRLRFSFEQMETVEVLMNAVKVRTMAYFVPMLALARFNGSMEQLNLSYEGKPPMSGQPVVPYIEQIDFGAWGANKVFQYLGLHGQPTQKVNSAYLEAYNQIWNFRAQNRSPGLVLRDRLAMDLAPAFWVHDQFAHMVPDFDQAVIDGQVALNVVNSQLAVRGLGLASQSGSPGAHTVKQTGDTAGAGMTGYGVTNFGASPSTGETRLVVAADVTTLAPKVFAELQQNGITVSLSNIELAKKTQAFAELRRQYNEHDDYIINLLMDAINIPEQAFKQPMLIGDKTTIFGQSKRYASDGSNLTKSVVNGMTQIEMSVQLPRVNMGGVVMVVAEITPDQLFERQEDPFLYSLSVDDLPQYLRDTLDPEKVDVVKNRRIDTSHATPNATFSYEPLNARWNVDIPRVGGKFHRPTVNTSFDEERQRIWAVETVNPTLSADFYLCTNIHQKPFVVTNRDAFEVVSQGEIFIEGNTVFGGHLVEATNDYAKVMAEAPQTRITK